MAKDAKTDDDKPRKRDAIDRRAVTVRQANPGISRARATQQAFRELRDEQYRKDNS